VRRFKVLGLVAVIVLSAAAIIAAPASAGLPGFSPETFTNGELAGGGATFEDGEAGGKIKCTHASNGGLSAEEGQLLAFAVFLTGCTGTVPHDAVCTSPSEPTGEIVLGGLGYLAYINAGENKVGASFEGLPELRGHFTEFECVGEGESVFVVGAGKAIGEVKPVNKAAKKFTIKFKQKHGKQEFALEGGPVESPLVSLDPTEYLYEEIDSPSGMTGSVTLKLPEKRVLIG
jgi:hypothetical protein